MKKDLPICRAARERRCFICQSVVMMTLTMTVICASILDRGDATHSLWRHGSVRLRAAEELNGEAGVAERGSDNVVHDSWWKRDTWCEVEIDAGQVARSSILGYSR
jgi:hypothetical protein